MNANELMIGDWVSSDARPARIAALQSKEYAQFDGDWANGEWTICIEQDGGYFIDSIDNCDFNPIPLTEEILKANGFEDGVLPYTLCNSKLMLSIQDCNGFWVFSCYVEKAELNDIMVAYVHELQHALRLCGLTELADNFKIK